jgi:hypothetical protein
VYTFIGARALKVDHGAKSPEEAPFIERFQSLGPDLPKAEFKGFGQVQFYKEREEKRRE